MANIMREALNATGMSLTLNCQGMSRVGIGISGTWAGTVTFFFSQDGINFAPNPLSAQPFASGPAVTSTTANGSWWSDCTGFSAVRVVFTRTSGTAVVALAASLDGSYQDAFLAASSIYISQSQAAGSANTVTVAAQANRSWRLRSLSVSWSAAPVAAVLCTVADGATVIYAAYVPVTVGDNKLNLPEDPKTPGVTGGGVYNTPGNTLVITVADPGGAVVSKLNAEVHAA